VESPKFSKKFDWPTSPKNITELFGRKHDTGKKIFVPIQSQDDTTLKRELRNVDTKGFFKGHDYNLQHKSYNPNRSVNN